MFEKSGNLKKWSSKNPSNLKGFLQADSRDQENNSKSRGIWIIQCSKNQGLTVLYYTFYIWIYCHVVFGTAE